MAISCEIKVVSVPEPGKLGLISEWTSNRSGGEFARFEVRLAAGGPFRFEVDGSQTTTLKIVRRKVTTNTQVAATVAYISLPPSAEKRLARFEFCGITKSASGAVTEEISKTAKFLP